MCQVEWSAYSIPPAPVTRATSPETSLKGLGLMLRYASLMYSPDMFYILYTSESDHLICVADLIYLLDSPFTSFSTPPIAFSRNRPTSRASMRYLHARFMYTYLYLGTLVSFSSVKSTLKTDISFLFLTCTCQQKRVKKCLTFHPRIAYTALFYPLPLRFCQKSFKTCGIQRCFSKEISPETKHSGLITDLMSTLSDRHWWTFSAAQKFILYFPTDPLLCQSYNNWIKQISSNVWSKSQVWWYCFRELATQRETRRIFRWIRHKIWLETKQYHVMSLVLRLWRWNQNVIHVTKVTVACATFEGINS